MAITAVGNWDLVNTDDRGNRLCSWPVVAWQQDADGELTPIVATDGTAGTITGRNLRLVRA